MYGLLIFNIYCHLFFRQRGSKTAGKCDICTKFFIGDNEYGARIDREFIVTKKSIEQLRIFNLMDQAKTKSVVLNLYYVVGDYEKYDLMRTENFCQTFFEVSSNSLGIYVAYLQTYLRVFFNLLKPITELITNKYLFENRCKKTV